MAGSKSRRHFLFTGNDERFISGNAYTIRQISDITGMTTGVIRNRLQDIGGFNDSHLFGVRPWGSKTKPSMTDEQKTQADSTRAKIIKSCVVSETQYIAKDDPVLLPKVISWIGSVQQESDHYWHKMDKLLLTEIMAMVSGERAAG